VDECVVNIVHNDGGVSLDLGVRIHAQNVDVLPAGRKYGIVCHTVSRGLDGAVGFSVLTASVM
jgi:hypothetical protein